MEMRLKPARTSRLSPCGVTLSGLASSVISGSAPKWKRFCSSSRIFSRFSAPKKLGVPPPK